MNIVMPNFALATAEMFVLGMACLILVVDLFVSERNRIFTYLLTQLTLIIAIVISLDTKTGVTFSGHFVSDDMGNWLKAFIYGITAVVFLYSRDYLKERGINKGEYYVLGLFAVLGMMIMVSAHSFLAIYLGLELLSLSLYAMVAFQRDNGVASEAAMKYFVLGAIASGMLLYGMSMIYGISHTLDIAGVSKYIAGQQGMDMVLSFGLVFVVIGLAFKLGAVPFHMWVPDVYHGAPTSVTLFLGTAPKLAAFAMAMRLLAESMAGLNADWQQMLMIMAVLSLAIGNVIAIAQTNMKRMLAYSTISHVGFIMLGILVGTAQGYSAAMFYTITYAIMALGAFGMMIVLSRKGFESDELADFKGLAQRSPWLGFIMLLMMFSMAGVPPTVGFYSKFMVLEAVVNSGLTWLAIVAVLFSVIGAFYYLRVIKLMYFDEPEQSGSIVCGMDSRLMLSTNGILVLLLGIFPGVLMTLCQTVIK